MGLFTSSISNRVIDYVVSDYFEKYLGTPSTIDEANFTDNFKSMVYALRQWSDEQDLSFFKRSRVTAGIEAGLRKILPADVSSDLARKAEKVITS